MLYLIAFKTINMFVLLTAVFRGVQSRGIVNRPSVFRNISLLSTGVQSLVGSTEIISESTVFQGYRNIIRRNVRLPNGASATYDLVNQKHASVVVLVWDRIAKTTTLVKEYHPGPNMEMYGTVAGMYEVDKHISALEAAQFELEEEAQLRSDNWYPLLDTTTTSMPFDKYSNNAFYPYLALDCTHVSHPKALDPEEYIEIKHNVTYQELMGLLHSGQINVVSAYAILLGLRKLEELGVVTV